MVPKPTYQELERRIKKLEKLIPGDHQAEEALPGSPLFLQAVLDALSANIAILNESGKIIAVNAAWRGFADFNNLGWHDYGVGRNYLKICESASGDYSDLAFAASAGIRKVMMKQQDHFCLEYPCHSPEKERWFIMGIKRLIDVRPAHLVVMHVDITERKLAEEALFRSHETLQRRVEERTAELSKANEELRKEIAGRKRTESALRSSEKDLKTKAVELEETNISLRVLLRKRDADKLELQEKFLFNIKELVLPFLEKIKNSSLDARQKANLGIVEANLNEIISPVGRKLSAKYFNLTRTELQVANLIMQGKTTKEIADMLNLSDKTIGSHRKNIRKKIGIRGQKINLQTYLLSSLAG